MDTDTLFMALWPADPRDAATLAVYWLNDQNISLGSIIQHLSAGMQFRHIEGGWSVHTTSEMAVPPRVGKPDNALGASSLWHIGLAACIACGNKMGTIIEAKHRGGVYAMMAAACEEIICPSPTVAMCLAVVKHPGITSVVRDVGLVLSTQCGIKQAEACMQRHMKMPLRVQTEVHHSEILKAVRRGRLEMHTHPTTGMVTMPYNVNLMCTSTDHALLFLLLIDQQATVIQDLLDDLRGPYAQQRGAVWDMTDATFLKCSEGSAL